MKKGVLFCIHLHTLKAVNCENLIICPFPLSPPPPPLLFRDFTTLILGLLLLVTHFKISEITSYECLLKRMLS